MLEDIKTKYFISTRTGTPVVSGDYRSLNSMLKTCLVDGFNKRFVRSATVTEEVLQIEFADNHPYYPTSVVRIEGIEPAMYARDFRVNSTTATTISILLDDSFTEQPIVNVNTFTIEAPLGYSVKFEEGGSTVYTSEAWDGCLKIVDSIPNGWDATYSKFARVQTALDYADINTPVGPSFPTSLDLTFNSSGVASGSVSRIYLSKSELGSRDTAVAPAPGERFWILVGDQRGFYLILNPASSTYVSTWTYSYFGTINVFNKQNTLVTDRTLVALCPYNNVLANAVIPISTLNTFLINGFSSSAFFSGWLITALSVESWGVFTGYPFNNTQTLSGGSFTSSVNSNSPLTACDVYLPIYFRLHSGEVLGFARGLQWACTNFQNDSTRPEYNYIQYFYNRLFNSGRVLLAMERAPAYALLETIKDWE